jgi:hypothetical protein
MELNDALDKMLKVESSLRAPGINSDPAGLSVRMSKLSQYTGAVEEKLAEYEKDLEVKYATQLKVYLLDNKMKVTEAERHVDMDLAELKGQVKYLGRLVASSWKQVGVIQSRINHLVREMGMPS